MNYINYTDIFIYHLNKNISIAIIWRFSLSLRKFLLLKTIWLYQYNHFNIDIHVFVIVSYNFSMYQCFWKSYFYENGGEGRRGRQFRVSHGIVPCVALLTADQFLQSNAGNESFISFCLINQFHAFVLRVYPQRNECKWHFAKWWIFVNINWYRSIF